MQGQLLFGYVRELWIAASIFVLAFLPNVHSISGQDAVDSGPTSTIYDHHVHVMSPQLIGHWKALGVTFSREDADYSDPIRILKKQNLAGAFAVSMAHLYANEELASLDEISGHQLEWLQKENDFVNQCVLKAPDRLVGFASVQPLWDGAIDEIERCRKMDGISGIKLHFPACGIDLAEPEHLTALQEVFTYADDHELPLLVHLFQADEENATELARQFWEQLVAPHPGIELYLAHLGAAGGYNPTSAAVLNGFQTLRDSSSEYTLQKVFFDLSGAILLTETDGIQPTTDENCRLLAEQISKTGIEHFLFASDFPVFSVADTIRALRDRLPLPAEELEKLVHSKSKRFDQLAELATITLPELRRELFVRMERDQEMRRKLVARQGNGSDGVPTTFDPAVVAELMKVDRENRLWLADQIEKHGWPGRSLVGTDGAHAAWLLVQHADQDPDFQQRCLDLMTAAGPEEVNGSDIAYLTDRVLVAQKKPQRYGTQASMVDGKIEIGECEDPENLDIRRAEVGLPPVAEYLEVMRKAYGLK